MVEKIKVLNLYAGIGGNRKLWKNVDVTAVEINPEIAKIYQDFFPDDKVIVADAHKYLLENIDKDWDFIWSSPPCPSHSRIRYVSTKARHPTCDYIMNKVYPDMDLYQEIILLKNYAKCKWVVENVISYYKPLIKPQEVGKHYWWANFIISKYKLVSRKHNSTIKELQEHKGFDISKYKLSNHKGRRRDQVLRNAIYPGLGLHIFNCAFKTKQVKITDLRRDDGE